MIEKTTALVLGLLVLCAGLAAATGQGETKAAEEAVVRVTFWGTEWIRDGMVEAGERFTANNPNIQIEWINVTGGGPWGRDKVMKHYPMSKVVSDIVDAMHTPF